MRHVVEVADMKLAGDGDILVTHALGSCLGLMIHDPVMRIGGLLHAMLPMSKINPEKARDNPFMFVDSGVTEMFNRFYDLGARKNRLVIKAAGCGQPLGRSESMNIGTRNYTVLKKLLWKNNLLLEAEDIGGKNSRTIHFDLFSGKVLVRGRNQEMIL